MTAHDRTHALSRAEELVVRELVNLVRANAADARKRAVPLEVLQRGREERDARAGEGDLRRGGHHPETVRVASLARVVEDGQNLREILGERVDRVRVVPHDAEVRGGGLQRGELASDLFRDGHARRIGEHRHRPHALNLWVLDELADSAHVRAVLKHRHGDELVAELLGDREVAVVARHRADPLNLVLLAPRALGVIRAPRVCKGDEVEHDVERGAIRRDEVLRRDAQQLAPQLANLADAVEVAVVAQVVARSVGVVALARQGQ